jgi:hypothetical protein
VVYDVVQALDVAGPADVFADRARSPLAEAAHISGGRGAVRKVHEKAPLPTAITRQDSHSYQGGTG